MDIFEAETGSHPLLPLPAEVSASAIRLVAQLLASLQYYINVCRTGSASAETSYTVPKVYRTLIVLSPQLLDFYTARNLGYLTLQPTTRIALPA